MAAEKDDSRIVPVHFCRVTVDAAYIAAWMIDYCNLIGRKVVFETSETCFWGCFTLFSQWIRTMRKYCILNEVHLSSIRLQRYKIPWCFRQECQLNARYFHGYYLLTKREKFSWGLFFPLLDLTLLPVYIITVIKVKLRVELYLFLLASKIVLWYDECMSNNLHLYYE